MPTQQTLKNEASRPVSQELAKRTEAAKKLSRERRGKLIEVTGRWIAGIIMVGSMVAGKVDLANHNTVDAMSQTKTTNVEAQPRKVGSVYIGENGDNTVWDLATQIDAGEPNTKGVIQVESDLEKANKGQSEGDTYIGEAWEVPSSDQIAAGKEFPPSQDKQ